MTAVNDDDIVVRVAVAPVDVVLDHSRSLILQPDVLFVATPRLSIIRDQATRYADGVDPIESTVLPGLELSAFGVFG